jgi:hypothetical protein
MPYAYEQDVPIGEDVYRKIAARLGDRPLDGLISHLVIKKSDGTLRYVDVWESREKCDLAFEQRIHPAVFATFKEVGFKPHGEPTRRELDVLEIRGGGA